MLALPSSSRYDRHRSLRSSQGLSQLPQLISKLDSSRSIISHLGRRDKWRWERLGQRAPSRPTRYPIDALMQTPSLCSVGGRGKEGEPTKEPKAHVRFI